MLAGALLAAVAFASGAASPQPPSLQPGESARMPGVPFDEIARRAQVAAEGGRLEEATRYYRAGLELNPRWADGWWRLALIHFDGGRYAEARDTLRRLLALEADDGPPWALLGLSEFQLGEYDAARASLAGAVARGVPAEQPMGRASILHLALLLVRSGSFAEAVTHLARLALLEPDDPALVAPAGLAMLRLAKLPSEIEEGEQELVYAAGTAAAAALAHRQDVARRAFSALVARFPGARGVHHAYGLFLSREAPDEALRLFRKEAELHPDHVEAHLEVAFACVDRGDPRDALPSARAVVRLAPSLPAGHLVLGRALVSRGELEEGIRDLEAAARMAPDDPETQLYLAQAYARAGRAEDVARARARLRELEARRGAH